MDFAASEAKKRGQSFPETAVNLRRKRPGTNQSFPMRPTSAGRSGPGFVPGTPVDFAGTKNFSPLRGAVRAQRLWMCPTRSHAAGTEKTPHLPGSQPAGSNSRPKAVDVLYPASAEGQRHKTKKAPGSDAFLLGTSGDTELFEKPSNINGFRASEQKNILYIPPL